MIITIFLYQIPYLHSYKRNIFFQSSLIILYIFFYFVKNPININCRLKQKQKTEILFSEFYYIGLFITFNCFYIQRKKENVSVKYTNSKIHLKINKQKIRKKKLYQRTVTKKPIIKKILQQK